MEGNAAETTPQVIGQARRSLPAWAAWIETAVIEYVIQPVIHGAERGLGDFYLYDFELPVRRVRITQKMTQDGRPWGNIGNMGRIGLRNEDSDKVA